MRRLVILFLACLPLPLLAESRVALVLGAERYEHLRPLNNPLNDARAVEEKLEALGFEVSLETNRDLRRMRRALDDFVLDYQGADVALVFFAGHGMEVSGQNLLLPTDAPGDTAEDLMRGGLPLDKVAAALQRVAPVGMLILDACRNDPFDAASDGRAAIALDAEGAVRPGLARMGRADNLLYAFSAAPGQMASDGTGDNSPFTSALVRHLATPGLEIRQVLTLVQQDVYDRTRGAQLPYVESGLPEVVFAAGQSVLPEREVLLLSMARMTAPQRDLIERVAATHDMPLAPLFGAFLSADLAQRSMEDQRTELTRAAEAFTALRADMAQLSSDDPQVALLRAEAQAQLELGAFALARHRLTEAAEIDQVSREALRDNYVERTRSEAQTHYLKAQTAQADLRRDLAITDYRRAADLLTEVASLTGDVPHRLLLSLESLGDALLLAGDLPAATAAYQEQHTHALTRLASDPDNTAWQRSVSVSHNRIGDVSRAAGDLPSARAAYEAGLKTAKKLAARDSSNSQRQRDLSVSYNKIGIVARESGDLKTAREAYLISLDIAKELAARDPSNTQWQRDLSVSYEKVGNVARENGDLDAARDTYEASISISKRLTAHDPSNTQWQRDLSVIHNKIGDIEREDGDLESAQVAYEAGLKIRQRLAARDPSNTQWQRDLSVSYERLGDVARENGDLIAAQTAYEATIAVVKNLVVLDPSNTDWARGLSIGHEKLGDVARDKKDLKAARDAYMASLLIAKKLASRDLSNITWQRHLSVSHEKVGDVARDSGDLIAARAAYQASLGIRETIAEQDQRLRIEPLLDLVVSNFKLYQAGDTQSARLEAALAILKRLESEGRLPPRNAAWIGIIESVIETQAAQD